MPPRQGVFARGGYYHLYNRGAGRRPIFFNPANYEHCLRLVKRNLRRCGAAVIAYCLMPNHYHFLQRQETDVPLSKLIGVVFSAYVQAVNIQQKRSGTLFEGRFRHKEIDKEAYLVQLCRYIHLNPALTGLCARPEEWPYSNYLEWLGQREGTLKDDAFIREWFGSSAQYQIFVEDTADEARMRAQLKRYTWD